MMNRTWKSVFSLLLALALLLPMAPAARAGKEDNETTVVSEATAIHYEETKSDLPPESPKITGLSAEVNGESSSKIYYRSGKNCDITVTATVDPVSYTGNVKWEFNPETAMIGFVGSSTTPVSNGKASVTLRATGSTGSDVTLSAKLSESSAPASHILISIAPDTVNPATTVFSQSSFNIDVRGTATVSFKEQPLYLSGDKASVTYYIVDGGDCVTVNSATGAVTGEKQGVAHISAQVGDEKTPVGASVTVSVSNPSTDLTGTATIGARFSMKDIYTKLRDQFIKTYGEPSSAAAITFTSLGSINGTLYTGNAAAAAKEPQSYRFSDLGDMYLTPTGEGDFRCEVTVKDGSKLLVGTIVISISVPDYPIRVPIAGNANYVFSKASADSSGKTGVQLIKEKVGTAFSSIEFGSVSTESSSVGTLYTSTQPSNESRVWPNGGTIVSASLLDELYFTPNRAGTYTIPFTAYSSPNASGSVVCKGTLILSVDGGSLDLTFNLGKVAPYTFSESPGSGKSSLSSLLVSAINSSLGSTWGGIKFDGAASASSTGTLHQSSSYSYAVSASDYISSGLISQLYYVPERTGTYEITYGVYASASGPVIATGKLTIKTSTIPTGTADIAYTTMVKETATLQESDFIDFFKRETSSKNELSYVVFNEYDGGGTFYHGTNSFLPYNSADFYTSTYSGTVPANARYLNRLSFTAPSDVGSTSVLFTCYGGTTTNSSSTTLTGKLCIYYTTGDVPVVSYNLSGVASVSLKEADFATAYNTAMKKTISRPTFAVQLLTAPSKGTLYHYYSGSSRRALTSSNIASYTFSVNDSSGSSVEDLTYIPGNKMSGADEISYLVTSSGGDVLYVGTIQFRLGSDLTLNVTNDGSNFQLANFYSASDSDPVLYVTFPRPSAGKVYVSAGGRYIAAPAETKFYTVSSSDGQYPITSAFYAPRANETGSVSVKCTVHRKSGATNENIITMNVLSKLSSATFGDVGGVTGWAANSIDFASKMGLVNGTQVNPPLFSPSDTMRRSDFVLMLYRLAGSPAVSGTVPYLDVPSGKYYYNSAVWAYSNNIVRNVTNNGLYDPEGALTRQDFAQILFNYTTAMGLSTANSGSLASYSDASSVSANTLEGVTWAVANGYITSAVVGRLYIEPTRSATRAEISTLLHRYLTY